MPSLKVKKPSAEQLAKFAASVAAAPGGTMSAAPALQGHKAISLWLASRGDYLPPELAALGLTCERSGRGHRYTCTAPKATNSAQMPTESKTMNTNAILTDRKSLRAAALAAVPLSRATLERETQSGGILYENPEGVPANNLRNANRAWRDLIRTLSAMSDDEADNILATLGVVRARSDKGWRYTLI